MHIMLLRVPNDRCGSGTAATSKMERFVLIVNGWKPLTTITKRSVLDVAAVLDPPLNEATPLRICSTMQKGALHILYIIF